MRKAIKAVRLSVNGNTNNIVTSDNAAKNKLLYIADFFDRLSHTVDHTLCICNNRY